MPGSTNPWAAELRTRKTSSTINPKRSLGTSNKGKNTPPEPECAKETQKELGSSDDLIPAPDETERGGGQDRRGSCRQAQVLPEDTMNPAKRDKSPNKNIYQDIRSSLKPTGMLLKPGSAPPPLPDGDDGDDNHIEKLLRSDSIEARKSSYKKDNLKTPMTMEEKRQEYLVLNYPADVRRNLKSLKSLSLADDDYEVEKDTNPPGKASKKDPEEEWEEDGEWEWEEEEEESAEVPVVDQQHSNGITNGGSGQDRKLKPDISIEGNLIRVDHTKPVEWSDDEDDNGPPAPPPPPPPPPPPASSSRSAPMPSSSPSRFASSNNHHPPPPAPPAPPGHTNVNNSNGKTSARIENLKRRPTKRPDWNELMREIETFRTCPGKLKKVMTNDRSGPMLTKTKFQGQFMYESEKKDNDILREITKGIKLKHVRTNDRSKPNLKGIRSFRRQTTKEERLKQPGFSFDEDFNEADEVEDVDKLRDDLESTKQLLELEIRSKALLEKDNKRLQMELERMKNDMCKLNASGGPSSSGNAAASEASKEEGTAWQNRKNSLAQKRQSIIRLLSESENVTSPPPPAAAHPEDSLSEEAEQYEESADIEEMREEVDEARKLAEEWELKYKEMQRQMTELEVGKKISTDHHGGLQRGLSVEDSHEPIEHFNQEGDVEDGWMQRREIRMLHAKLRTVHDKREVVVRERKLLTERIETLIRNIEHEMEARKKLRKEIKEMNEAFKKEISDMMAEERTAAELEECYFSEEELVQNTYKVDKSEPGDEDEEDWEEEVEEEEFEETLDDIIKAAESSEEDQGKELFDQYPYSPDTLLDEESNDEEAILDNLHTRIAKHGENVQIMRKSNFLLKTKIDRLYDILQMQKEIHEELRQELTRTLSDIQ